jgi:hypothetical protein
MGAAFAERTLVKSPPELWAELSDPASLARRLGEFGEIRILRLEPEKTVVWEGERASGTVELEPAGWGTRVRLTAATAGDEPTGDTDPDAQEPEAGKPDRGPIPLMPARACAGTDSSVADEQPRELASAALQPVAEPLPDSRLDRTDAATPEEDAPGAPVGRRGFFARIFARGRGFATGQATPPAAELAGKPAPRVPARAELVKTPAPSVAAQAQLAETPAPSVPARAEVAEDLPPRETDVIALAGPSPSEPVADETRDRQAATAVLSGVLDDLGAAHHRPFSRG